MKLTKDNFFIKKYLKKIGSYPDSLLELFINYNYKFIIFSIYIFLLNNLKDLYLGFERGDISSGVIQNKVFFLLLINIYSIITIKRGYKNTGLIFLLFSFLGFVEVPFFLIIFSIFLVVLESSNKFGLNDKLKYYIKFIIPISYK